MQEVDSPHHRDFTVKLFEWSSLDELFVGYDGTVVLCSENDGCSSLPHELLLGDLAFLDDVMKGHGSFRTEIQDAS
jgi:hypothetical protein